MQKIQNQADQSGQSQGQRDKSERATESGSTRQRQSEQQQKQRADFQQQPGQHLGTKEQQQIDRDHAAEKEGGSSSS